MKRIGISPDGGMPKFIGGMTGEAGAAGAAGDGAIVAGIMLATGVGDGYGAARLGATLDTTSAVTKMIATKRCFKLVALLQRC